MSTSDFDLWEPVDDDENSAASVPADSGLGMPISGSNEACEASKLSRSPIRSLQNSTRESISSIDGTALKSTPADPHLSAADPVAGVNSPYNKDASALSSVNYIIEATKESRIPEEEEEKVSPDASNGSFFNNMITSFSFKGGMANTGAGAADNTLRKTPTHNRTNSEPLEGNSAKIISYRKVTPSRKPKRSTSIDSGTPQSPLQEMSKPEELLASEYNKKLYVEETLAGTNYHYATNERNVELHKIFKSIPLEDRLLDDFSCALSREFLFQGRIYVTKSNLCFNSNLLGWVTHLVISLRDVTMMEKTSTAGLFPNGIAIETRMGKHQFVSFISRDTTFDFIKAVWNEYKGSDPAPSANMSRQSSFLSLRDDPGAHTELVATIIPSDAAFDIPPSRASMISENNSVIEDAILSVDDFTPNITLKKRIGESTLNEEDDDDDEDDDEDDDDDEDIDDETANTGDGTLLAVNADTASTSTQNVFQFVEGSGFEYDGPTFFQETKFLYDPEQNNEIILAEEEFNAPPGVIYQLIFSGDRTTFLQDFLKEQNSSNISEIPAFDQVNKDGQQFREFSYAKALNYPVGPKSTKCLSMDTVLSLDYENCINVVNTTRTPDVPSGNSFSVKTRYMMRWSSPTKSVLKVSFWVEWTGSSWIKSMIDKSCRAGQVDATQSLIQLLREYVSKFTKEARIEVKQQPQKKQPQSRRVSRNSARPVTPIEVATEKVVVAAKTAESDRWNFWNATSLTHLLLVCNLFLLVVILIREQTIMSHIKKYNANRWTSEKETSVDQMLNHFKTYLASGAGPVAVNAKGEHHPSLQEWLQKHGNAADPYNLDAQKKKQYQRYMRYIIDQWIDDDVPFAESEELLRKLDKLRSVVNNTRQNGHGSDAADASNLKDAVDYLMST